MNIEYNNDFSFNNRLFYSIIHYLMPTALFQKSTFSLSGNIEKSCEKVSIPFWLRGPFA